ncbi:MAG TPA: PepSY-associated TM helix domain-containing protein [Roseomonas sp.]|jgi:hypothetical protein
MSETVSAKISPPRGNRSFWLKHLHRWHWISAALSLVGMLLFAATGITLNHAADIPATPQRTERSATLPPPLRAMLVGPDTAQRPVPPAIRDWIRGEFSARIGDDPAEWSRDEIYLVLPRPGAEATLSIDRESGEVRVEVTTRGWIAYLNDLHKGRHTGPAWSWFIDVFAGACLVFCATGLILLHLHAGSRPSTWPIVGLGLIVPIILAILFIH